MIKIYFDNTAVFFEFEGAWLGTLLYIGNNKFYFKYTTADGTEGSVIFTAKDYLEAIRVALSFIYARGGRIGWACQITTEMLLQGQDLRDDTNMA